MCSLRLRTQQVPGSRPANAPVVADSVRNQSLRCQPGAPRDWRLRPPAGASVRSQNRPLQPAPRGSKHIQRLRTRCDDRRLSRPMRPDSAPPAAAAHATNPRLGQQCMARGTWPVDVMTSPATLNRKRSGPLVSTLHRRGAELELMYPPDPSVAGRLRGPGPGIVRPRIAAARLRRGVSVANGRPDRGKLPSACTPLLWLHGFCPEQLRNSWQWVCGAPRALVSSTLGRAALWFASAAGTR